ncbi:MAG: ATP-dependent zinc metalloprotease FtsH [Clostridiales bacterium]|nr:ATP-dependent zinc metalloprotease FtsH [Clostridiales bacterium]
MPRRTRDRLEVPLKKSYKGFPVYALIIVGVLIAAQLFSQSLTTQRGVTIEYSKLMQYIDDGVIAQVALQGDTAYARQKASSISEAAFSPEAYDYATTVSRDTFVETCRQLAAKRTGEPVESVTELDLGFELIYLPPVTTPWYIEFLPYVIMLVICMAFWMMMMRQQGGGGKMMNFGHSTARVFEPDGNRITFADVAGAVEEKEEMQELVEFLKNPKRFTSVGARIPKGVLLVGPPGTGKTLLAKAVAGEAGVPFMSISGSDFVEMFVGVGASRVRDLFDQAKRHAPCIVFIDEIDAVGRRRGAGLGGGHDEREQTLNQLLVEMDGFAVNEGVIVLAATNRKDILDPALLRPGRFDRQITVGYPDVRGREAILRVHAKDKPLADDVDLSTIAKRTPYFAGADLENIMNEAAILCAREGKDRITARHMNDAIERVQMGPEKKSHIVTPQDKRLVACHEAGHAIVGELLPGCDKVHLVTIMPRGGSGGHTLLLPDQESDYTTRSQLLDYVAMALGGYAAESLVIGEVSTGAGSDLQHATDTCRRMVTQYGMSDDMGPIYLGGDHDQVFLARDYGQQSRTYSEEVAARIDAEVQRKMNEGFERAKAILTENRDKLDGLSELLIERETLNRAEFEAFMKGEPLPEEEPQAQEQLREPEPIAQAE